MFNHIPSGLRRAGLRGALAAAALTLLAGGLSVASAQEQSGKKRMGVPPFEAKMLGKGHGETLADMLVTDLMQNRNYELIERSKLNRVTQEQALGASGLVDQSNAAQIGKVAGLDYIVLGTLSEASAAYSSTPSFVVKGQTDYYAEVRITVNVNVVEVETGKIVLAEKGNNKDNIQLGHSPGMKVSDEGFMTVAKNAIKKAAFRIMSRIAPNQAKVLAALKDGKSYKEVTINQGSDDGVREGAKWVIFREGEALTDPDTGEVLDVQQIDVAWITITKVNARSAVAKVAKMMKDPQNKGDFEINRGDLAKMQDETEARSAGEKFGKFLGIGK